MTTNRQPARRRRLKREWRHSRTAVTLTAASASTGAINLLGGKMRRVRAVCLPASEGVGPRVRIRLAPAASQQRTRADPTLLFDSARAVALSRRTWNAVCSLICTHRLNLSVPDAAHRVD